MHEYTFKIFDLMKNHEIRIKFIHMTYKKIYYTYQKLQLYVSEINFLNEMRHANNLKIISYIC